MNQELISLFEEARPHLRHAFPNLRGLTVREQWGSDESPLVKVTVSLPPDFANPEAALRMFDEEWWLENCHRSHGNLVFDYEQI